MLSLTGRILIAARRNAHAENAPLPDENKAVAIRKDLVQRGDISPVNGVEGVYLVDVPYANLLEVSEQQIIQEANPWAAFGFLTAMAHHGLTDLLPKKVFAIGFKDGEPHSRVPLGTTPDDWVDLKSPTGKHPDKVNEIQIIWTHIEAKWEFGVTVGYSLGGPIYVTDLERTLIDGIRMPEKCGGIGKVLQAWRSADGMDVDRVVAYADRYNIQNLRQRVGFLLEKLRREHPRLKEWQHRLQRGGSVKLVAGDPYSATYSTEWNLSLNVPPSVLAMIEQD